jgi:hypothetical protein
VAYSVMVWLVDPGEQAHQEQAMQRTTTGRSQAPVLLRALMSPPPSLVWCMESMKAWMKPRMLSLRSLRSCERTSHLR